MPTLRISTEKVCYVVVKARQFDVKVAPEWLNGGSNPTDDGMTRVLEDYKDDPTLMELRSYLRAMNEDELEDLIALTLLGRGDYTIDEWEDLMIEARELREDDAVRYLTGIPLLGDYLEDGLNEFGLAARERGDVEVPPSRPLPDRAGRRRGAKSDNALLCASPPARNRMPSSSSQTSVVRGPPCPCCQRDGVAGEQLGLAAGYFFTTLRILRPI